MAAHCDLRDPGWGDPGFLQGALLLLSPPVAILFVLFGLVLVCFALMAGVVHGTEDAIAYFFSGRIAIPYGLFFFGCFLFGFCLLLLSCLVLVFVFGSARCFLCFAHEAWECSSDYVQVRNCPLL